MVKSFDEVKYKSGVAIIFTTQNQEIQSNIKNILENTDWSKYATLATNSCYHIGKSNIFDVLQDNKHLLNYKNQIKILNKNLIFHYFPSNYRKF